MDTKPLVYTTADLAKMLLVDPRTIRRWAAASRLPAPVLPGRWDKDTFDHWWRGQIGQARTFADIGKESH